MVGLPKEAAVLPDGYTLHRQPEREGRSGCCEENLSAVYPDSPLHHFFISSFRCRPIVVARKYGNDEEIESFGRFKGYEVALIKFDALLLSALDFYRVLKFHVGNGRDVTVSTPCPAPPATVPDNPGCSADPCFRGATWRFARSDRRYPQDYAIPGDRWLRGNWRNTR